MHQVSLFDRDTTNIALYNQDRLDCGAFHFVILDLFQKAPTFISCAQFSFFLISITSFICSLLDHEEYNDIQVSDLF